MNLTIACSYCRRQMILKISSALVVNGRGAKLGGPVRCDACGSTTQITIATKRVRKGKEMRNIEDRAAAKIAALVSMCRERNKLIGDRLLAQPGCTCQKMHDDYPGRTMTNEGHDGGHFLSTGWSRDKGSGGMLPTLPRHYHHCPCHDTDEERRIMAAQLAEHVTASAPVIPEPKPQPETAAAHAGKLVASATAGSRNHADDIASAVQLILEALPQLQTFTINVDEHGEAHVDYQIKRVVVTTEGGSLKVKR